MSPNLGFQEKLNADQVDRTEGGELSKTNLESGLANGIKSVLESSSKAIFADDQRNDQESWTSFLVFLKQDYSPKFSLLTYKKIDISFSFYHDYFMYVEQMIRDI